MAATTKIFTDVPNNLEASDINGFNLENNNLISSSGIVLDTDNNEQSTRAVANYIGQNSFFFSEGENNEFNLKAPNAATNILKYAEGINFLFLADKDCNDDPTMSLPNLPLIPLVSPFGIPLNASNIAKGIHYDCVISEEGGISCIVLNSTTIELPYLFSNATSPQSFPLSTNLLIFSNILAQKNITSDGQAITIERSGIYEIKASIMVYIRRAQFISFSSTLMNIDLKKNGNIIDRKTYNGSATLGGTFNVTQQVSLGGFFALDANDIIQLSASGAQTSGSETTINRDFQGRRSFSSIYLKMLQSDSYNLNQIWVDESQDSWENEFNEPWTNI